MPRILASLLSQSSFSSLACLRKTNQHCVWGGSIKRSFTWNDHWGQSLKIMVFHGKSSLQSKLGAFQKMLIDPQIPLAMENKGSASFVRWLSFKESEPFPETKWKKEADSTGILINPKERGQSCKTTKATGESTVQTCKPLWFSDQPPYLRQTPAFSGRRHGLEGGGLNLGHLLHGSKRISLGQRRSAKGEMPKKACREVGFCWSSPGVFGSPWGFWSSPWDF